MERLLRLKDSFTDDATLRGQSGGCRGRRITRVKWFFFLGGFASTVVRGVEIEEVGVSERRRGDNGAVMRKEEDA